MNVIKPLAMGLSFRPVEYRKRFGLCVSGYLHVPFAQSAGGTLWGEQSMWNFLAGEMQTPVIDEGVSKLTSEFLVHGYAYPAPGRNNAVAVRARLGSVEKTLLAFGDRYWDGNRATAPAPFQRIPLTWPNAYGGPDFADNPLGKGRSAVDGVRWLPNLELPGSRLTAPRESIAPAGFGPLDVTNPQRAELRGTYDDRWLKEHSPGYAPDLAWKHFNMAPRDQWFAEPLRGDESYALENLHPDRRLIEGTLPGLRVRTFVRRRAAGLPEGSKLREVSMRLSTVWLFPHAERMVLVFHGMAETVEDDAEDIDLLLGLVDRIDPSASRPDSHFLDVLRKRSDPDDGIYEALNDADLLPPGLDTHDPSASEVDSAMKTEGLREDAAYRRADLDIRFAREAARRSGKDPDALNLRLPPRETPPTPAELPERMRLARKQVEEQQWAMLETVVGQLEKVQALTRQGKIDPEKMIERGPPTFSAAPIVAQLEKVHAIAKKPFDRATTTAKLRQLENVKKLGYLQTAHLQEPARPLTGSVARDRRAEMEWMLSEGLKVWSGFDLTGVDLSGLDLREVDLSGAWLESANLENSNLSRATFQAAVLAHANLRGAIAVGTDFRAANLGAAMLEKSQLDRCDLSGAILMRAQLIDTELREARVASANLFESIWQRAECTRMEGAGLTFHALDLKESSFSQARLAGSVFIECDVSGVDFTGADLSGASFTGCNAQGTRFAGAKLAAATFVGATRLERANFGACDLRNANFGDSDATGARFVDASLDSANLCLANLSDCDLRCASAKGALFRKSVLRNANLAGADLKDAILQKADLRGANLQAAHLFGADLSRVRLDADVKLDGAILERARTYPRLTLTQQQAQD